MKKKSTFAAKRKYRPKKLPIIIAALIIMTVTAVISFATTGDTFTIKVDGAQTSNYHEFTYKVLSEPNTEKNGTVQLSEYVYHTLYIDDDGDKLTIPATVTYEDKTYDVTEIGEDAFKNHAQYTETQFLTSVTLPSTLETIHPNAFYNCVLLTNVFGISSSQNPDLQIKDEAFWGCCSLNEAYLPDGEYKPFGEEGTDFVNISMVKGDGIDYLSSDITSIVSSITGNTYLGDIQRVFNTNDLADSFKATISVTCKANHNLVALMRIPSAEYAATIDEQNYDIDDFFSLYSTPNTDGSGQYNFPLTTFDQWKANPVIYIQAKDTSTPVATPLTPPTVAWNDTTYPNEICATWSEVTNATKYIIKLYKGDQHLETVTENTSAILNHKFTDKINENGTGTYYFEVTAIGDGTTHTDSDTVKSGPYEYTAPANPDEPNTPAVPSQYTITSSTGSGGSITPAGTTKVNEGGSQEYVITVEEGYEIASVIVDGESVGTPSSYTFSNVTANHEIKVEFTLVSNRIGDVATSYPKGTDVTFTGYGHNMENTEPKTGDIRWKPSTWRLDQIALQQFGEGTVTDTFSTSSLTKGTHKLKVTFVKQRFNGSEWVNIEDTDSKLISETKEVSFEVTAATVDSNGSGNTDSNGTGNNNSASGDNNNSNSGDGTTNSGSGNSTDNNTGTSDGSGNSSGDSVLSGVADTVTGYFTNPQTGDILPARVLFAGGLALAMLVIFGLVATMPKPARKRR